MVFIPDIKYIKYFHATTRIHPWTPNGISEENIEDGTKSDSNFAPTFLDHHLLPDINFNGHCLIKNDVSIPQKSNKSIYFLGAQLRNLNTDFSFGNCLFGSVKLTKNSDTGTLATT